MIKNLITRLKERNLTLYPMLMGVLFLLNELRNNGRFYTAKDNILLITIILAFCFLVDLLSRKLVKNNTKAALIATTFIVINLFYLDISSWLNTPIFLKNLFSDLTHGHSVILIIPVLGILWMFFSYIIIKYKRGLLKLNLYLNIIIIAFIGIEIIKWLILPQYDIALVEKNKISENKFINAREKPNIYYIILDAYTSSESLKKYWKFDNTPFEDSLKGMGFYIAHKSTSDYTSTPYCLASYLNVSLLKIDSTKKYNERNLLCLIRNSRLEKSLEKQGYQFVNYSLFDVDKENHLYNFYFTYNHYLGRTIWYTNVLKLWQYIIPQYHISNTNLNTINMLENLSRSAMHTPLFVYAHIMMPHGPYIFNEDGKKMENSEQILPEKIKYLKQLRFENTLVIKAIRQILVNEKREPIIIIQGDHGFRNLDNVNITEKAKESHTILNAYLVPENIRIKLNDSIKPIQGLKLIFE